MRGNADKSRVGRRCKMENNNKWRNDLDVMTGTM